MSSREFSEWLIFQRLEGPLGPERDDWRVGTVASTVANGYRDSKRHRRPWEPKDFIPDWAAANGVSKPAPALETVESRMKAFFGGLAKKGRQ